MGGGVGTAPSSFPASPWTRPGPRGSKGRASVSAPALSKLIRAIIKTAAVLCRRLRVPTYTLSVTHVTFAPIMSKHVCLPAAPRSRARAGGSRWDPASPAQSTDWVTHAHACAHRAPRAPRAQGGRGATVPRPGGDRVSCRDGTGTRATQGRRSSPTSRRPAEHRSGRACSKCACLKISRFCVF